MKTDYIDYRDGDVALEGYFAFDETAAEPRPLVLIAHDWSGRRTFACGMAERMTSWPIACIMPSMKASSVLSPLCLAIHLAPTAECRL